MSKLLSSIPLNNLTDYIVSIDDYTFPEGTLVTDAGLTYQCVIKTCIDPDDQTETLHLVMGAEEGSDATVTLVAPEVNSTPYEKTTKNWVIPILSGNEGILFGGHPVPKPPKAVEA